MEIMSFRGTRISALATMVGSAWLSVGCAASGAQPVMAEPGRTAALRAPGATATDAHDPGARHAAQSDAAQSDGSQASAGAATVDAPTLAAEAPSTEAVDPFADLEEPPRCPSEMTLVGEVCVDRWEATLVVRAPGGTEKAWSPFKSLDGVSVELRAVSRQGVVPQGYISGDDAARACTASGKRLCSAPEWDAACRGPHRTTYPYGNERKKRSCNDEGRRVHPVADVTKRLGLPAERMWYEGMGHPLINQLDDTLRKTGERSECTNGYGAFDMVGNLHEWIDDPEGTFRGGFYMDTKLNGEGCDYQTAAHATNYHDYSTGFRCCLDADPVE
jgi:sulfatase modifying factor 1